MTNPIKEFGKYLISGDIVESFKKYKEYFKTSKAGDFFYGVGAVGIRYGGFWLVYDGIKCALTQPEYAVSGMLEAVVGIGVAIDSANRFRTKECLIGKLGEYKLENDRLKEKLEKKPVKRIPGRMGGAHTSGGRMGA